MRSLTKNENFIYEFVRSGPNSQAVMTLKFAMRITTTNLRAELNGLTKEAVKYHIGKDKELLDTFKFVHKYNPVYAISPDLPLTVSDVEFSVESRHGETVSRNSVYSSKTFVFDEEKQLRIPSFHKDAKPDDLLFTMRWNEEEDSIATTIHTLSVNDSDKVSAEFILTGYMEFFCPEASDELPIGVELVADGEFRSNELFDMERFERLFNVSAGVLLTIHGKVMLFAGKNIRNFTQGAARVKSPQYGVRYEPVDYKPKFQAYLDSLVEQYKLLPVAAD